MRVKENGLPSDVPLPHLTEQKDQAGLGTRILGKLGMLIFPIFIAARLIYKISTQGHSKQTHP